MGHYIKIILEMRQVQKIKFKTNLFRSFKTVIQAWWIFLVNKRNNENDVTKLCSVWETKNVSL